MDADGFEMYDDRFLEWIQKLGKEIGKTSRKNISRATKYRALADDVTKIGGQPVGLLLSSSIGVHSKTCRILLLLSVPGHLIFISCVHFLKSSNTPLTAQFLLFYVCAALLQVALLLYAAHCFVRWLWRWGVDPDDAAIPYLTALGDLLGTAFLFLAFLAMDTVQ